MGEVKLKTKIAMLLVVLFFVSLLGNIAWTSYNQRAQTEGELHEKAQVLTQQMMAVWDFMSVNQGRFDKAEFSITGSYQGIYCAIAGRTIGHMFTNESGYIMRFVNFNPRNAEGEPDEFEALALNAFLSDQNSREYFGITGFEGEEVYRYLVPMRIERTCLDCHGSPKGELDVTGYEKEGWELGDVGGAMSVVIPIDLYRQAERESVTQNVVFFVGVMVACLLIVYLALTYLVTGPLQRIRGAIEHMKQGDLGTGVKSEDSSLELGMLSRELNKMASELSGLYAGLEAQVEDRTQQLVRANCVLEEQRIQLERANELLRNDNKYKSDFLAMMSHELRTPLTSIIAFSEMLNKEGEPRDEKEAEIRREIEANGRVLLLMINDILEMSRVDAGRTELALEPVDLGDVVGLVQSVVAPLARRNGLEFSCDIDPDVPLILGDFEKIRHIMENLCGNAMKFTPSGGSVKLTVVRDVAGQAVLVCVSDTGIGIAPADQERIFERFVQADSSASRKFNGTGLGLALAKEYTEMHGGSIAVESVLGKGSTFTVRLPVDPMGQHGPLGRCEGEARPVDSVGCPGRCEPSCDAPQDASVESEGEGHVR